MHLNATQPVKNKRPDLGAMRVNAILGDPVGTTV